MSPEKLESILPCDIINWKLFDFAIYRLWYNFGSSHSLFRHSGDFKFLNGQQKGKLEEINECYGKTLENRESTVQPMVEANRKTFKSLAKRFNDNFNDIINKSEQIFLTFKDEKMIIYFRRDITDDDMKLWKATCSDGTRRNIYESDGVVKLISLQKISSGREELEKYSVKHWYVYGESYSILSPIDKETGIFVQLNNKVIGNKNGILLNLFRNSNPEFKNINGLELNAYLKQLGEIYILHISIVRKSILCERRKLKARWRPGDNDASESIRAQQLPIFSETESSDIVYYKSKEPHFLWKEDHPTQREIDTSMIEEYSNQQELTEERSFNKKRERRSRKDKYILKKSLSLQSLPDCNGPKTKDRRSSTSHMARKSSTSKSRSISSQKSCMENSELRKSQLGLDSDSSSTKKQKKARRKKSIVQEHYVLSNISEKMEIVSSPAMNPEMGPQTSSANGATTMENITHIFGFTVEEFEKILHQIDQEAEKKRKKKR